MLFTIDSCKNSFNGTLKCLVRMISIIFKEKTMSNSVMEELRPAECDCLLYTRLHYVWKFLLFGMKMFGRK